MSGGTRPVPAGSAVGAPAASTAPHGGAGHDEPGQAAPYGGSGPDAASASAAARGRREMAVAVLGCVLGAATVLFAAGATWATARVAAAAGAAGTAAPVAVELGGGDLAPATTGLGLVGLAGVLAVAATRRLGRTLVGVALLAAGIGIAVVAGRIAADPVPAVSSGTLLAEVAQSSDAAVLAVQRSFAPVASCLGGVVLAGAGLLVAARGRSWPALSGRYQARPAVPTDAWEAIERGQDPTSAAP